MVQPSYKEKMEKPPVVLTLKLENSVPVSLDAFINHLVGFSQEFEKSALESEPDFIDAEIFIQEIRSGSIIADLIPFVASTIPLIASEADKVFVAVEFVKKWQTRLTMLAQGIVPEGSTKGDLGRWAKSVEAIARDPMASSTLEAATFVDGKRDVLAHFTFRTSEARRIQDTIEGEFRRLDDEKSADHVRVLMTFTRSDVADAPVGRRTGEKVVIEEISTRPLAITYGSEIAEQRIKYEIREGDDNIYKKGFVVDVKVQYRGSKPVAYSILHVHDIVDISDE